MFEPRTTAVTGWLKSRPKRCAKTSNSDVMGLILLSLCSATTKIIRVPSPPSEVSQLALLPPPRAFHSKFQPCSYDRGPALLLLHTSRHHGRFRCRRDPDPTQTRP